MSTPFKLATVVLVSMVAAVGVLPLLPRAPDTAGAPSPTPLSATAGPAQPWRAGPLPAGTYVANVPEVDDLVRVSFTVPAGWSGWNEQTIAPTDAGTGAPAGASLGFDAGGALHSEPCRAVPDPPDIPVGPSVDDLADALSANPALDTTTPIDVTLGGYAGSYMDLQVPVDISACPRSYYAWEPAMYAQGSAERWHLWILDVEGVRLVVEARDYAGTSPNLQAELRTIVDSIEIDPRPDPVATPTPAS